MPRNPAQKAHIRRVAGLAGGYTCTVASQLPGAPVEHPVVAGLLALTAGLLAAGFFVSIAVYLRQETDEYLRFVEARRCLAATGLFFLLLVPYAFFELYGLAPRPPLFFVCPLWFACLGLVWLAERLAALRPNPADTSA